MARGGSMAGMRLLVIAALVLLAAWTSAGEARLDLGNGVTIALVEVPVGNVRLGSPPDEAGRSEDEPLRTVRLTRPFAIGVSPVTRGQFARFVAATSYRTEAEVGSSGGWGLSGGALVQRKEFTWRNPGFAQDDTHPVVLVTWGDAKAFCAWAGKQSGRSVALPSEAQWECACRGGADGAWNGRRVTSVGGTRPIGQDEANPLGLHDLLGQVNQWCADFHVAVPPGGDDPLVNADPGGTSRRALRGGSYHGEAQRRRPAARWRNTPGTRNADNGFRIVVVERGSEGSMPSPPATNPFRPRAPVVPGEVATPATPAANPFRPRTPIMPGGPVAPVAPPEPPAPLAAPPQDAGWGWIVLFGGGAVVVVVLVYKFFTAGGNAKRPVRLAADGFWISCGGARRGQRLRYRFLTEGRWHEDSFTVDGDATEQFVYTGVRPEQALLLSAAVAPPAPAAKRRERPEHRNDDGPLGGTFPSAY